MVSLGFMVVVEEVLLSKSKLSDELPMYSGINPVKLPYSGGTRFLFAGFEVLP